MKIYHCTDQHIYDIETSEQGVVFLCLAFVYFVFEAIYLWQNIQIFRREQGIHKSPTLLIFYISMHILFIKTLLYSLGGTILCYNETIYVILSQYLYVFKRFVLFIIVYRIAVTLRHLSELSENQQFPEKIVLVLGGVDFAAYSMLYFLFANNLAPDLPLQYYALVVEFVLIALFAYFVYKLMKRMAQVLKYIGTYNEMAQWYVFILIISVSFAMCVANTLFYIMYHSEHRRPAFLKEVVYSVYIGLYLILTEIVPCIVMLWIIASSDSSKQTFIEKRDSQTFGSFTQSNSL